MTSILTASRNALKRSLARSVAPTFGTTPRFSSTVHDNDPDVLDLEKRRNLAGIQHETSTPISSAPGWNHDLASDSEAVVKAERHDASPQDLQNETVEYVRKRHRANASSPAETLEPGVSTQKMKHNGFAEPEAPYSHDVVDGPLGGESPRTVETVEREVITRKVV